MADLGYEFDPSTVEADERKFDVIPAGPQPAQIVESDVKAVAGDKWNQITLTWQILSGPYENRKVWQRINVPSMSTDYNALTAGQAQSLEIGPKQFKSICEAVGVGAVRNTDDLHFKPAIIVLKIKTDEKYGEQNQVSYVKPYVGGSTAQARPAPPSPPQPARAAPPMPPKAQPQPATAGGGNRPWR